MNDFVIITDNIQEAQYMLEELEKSSNNASLQINNTNITQVTRYKYMIMINALKEIIKDKIQR